MLRVSIFLMFLTVQSIAFSQVEKDLSFTIDCHQYLVTQRADLKFGLRLTNIGERPVIIWDKHRAEAKNKGNVMDISYEIISCPKGDTITKTDKIISFSYQPDDIEHKNKRLSKFESEAFTLPLTEDFFLIYGGLHKIRFTYRIFLNDKNPFEVSTNWVYLYVDKSSKHWK